ncbi:MAG: hypothetical protein IH577_01530 [Deltaproteobacteria bacterium]|nr:hypothetical protein [Deltaproteobacteria bacterium]
MHIMELESSLKDASEGDGEQIKKRIAEAREHLKVLEQTASELGLDDHARVPGSRGSADKPAAEDGAERSELPENGSTGVRK